MGWTACLKPGASIRTHLLVAALMWSLIGSLLMLRGGLLLRGDSGFFLVGALTVGAIKSRLLLDRSARKNAARILTRHDGVCLGGVYSWKMWGFIVCMMLGGRLLRAYLETAQLVGLLYLAVGFALALSSRILWRYWQQEARAIEEQSESGV